MDLTEFLPPDSYEEGLQRLRKELQKLGAIPDDTKKMPLDANGVPDAYAAGIERMRREEQR